MRSAPVLSSHEEALLCRFDSGRAICAGSSAATILGPVVQVVRS